MKCIIFKLKSYNFKLCELLFEGNIYFATGDIFFCTPVYHLATKK